MNDASYQTKPLPSAFIWRRIHSFMGLWLVIFLIEHLLTNSQAALFFGDDGNGFVRAVNALHNLPYLPVIEITLLGVPFLVHMVWGIQYLLTSKQNAYGNDGKSPSLGEYPRNHAYTWQRITSWILLIGIIAHVIDMRILDYPETVQRDNKTHYRVEVDLEPGIYSLSQRLGFTLEEAEKGTDGYAVTDNFGTAELLVVRETFKSPLMIALYTFFVLAAVFHGFNGLWTFCITWGITLTERAQRRMRTLSTLLMILIAFLGLAAIWGTYWINLRH